MMRSAGYKRQNIGNDNYNVPGASSSAMSDIDYLYYNASVVSDSTNRFSIAPASAYHSEVRALPLINDTTGWNAAVASISTSGTSTKLPLLIPTRLSSGTNSIYNVGLKCEFLVFQTGNPPSSTNEVNLPTGSSSTYYTNGYSSGGFPFTGRNSLQNTSYGFIAATTIRIKNAFNSVSSPDIVLFYPDQTYHNVYDFIAATQSAVTNYNANFNNTNPSGNNLSVILNVNGAAGLLGKLEFTFSSTTPTFMGIVDGPNVPAGSFSFQFGASLSPFFGSQTSTNSASSNSALFFSLTLSAAPSSVGMTLPRDNPSNSFDPWILSQNLVQNETVTAFNSFQIPIDYVPGSGATVSWSYYAATVGNTGSWSFALSRYVNGVYVPIVQRVVTSASYIGDITTPTQAYDVHAKFIPGEFVFMTLTPSSYYEDPPNTDLSQEFIVSPFGIVVNDITYNNCTKYEYRASAAVSFEPQHAANPTWVTSYDHFSRSVNKAISDCADNVESQLANTPYGGVGPTLTGTCTTTTTGTIAASTSITISSVTGTGFVVGATLTSATNSAVIQPNTTIIATNGSTTLKLSQPITFNSSGTTTLTFKAFPVSGQITITTGSTVSAGTLTDYTPSSATGTVTVGSYLVVSNSITAYVTAINASKISFSATQTFTSSQVLNFQTYPASFGTVTLASGSVTSGTPYFFSGAITGSIFPGAAVSGSGITAITRVTAVTANSITFDATFSASTGTYTFVNQFNELAGGALLRYDPPKIKYDSATSLFSMNVDPMMVVGRSMIPGQAGETGSTVSTTGVMSSKYRLFDGTLIDASFAIGQGPLIFPGVGRSYIETWTIYFNEPLQSLLTFPIRYSNDMDSSINDAFSNELSFQSSSLVAVTNPYTSQGTSATTQYVLRLTQEFNTTSSWTPFIGLVITSTSIPGQLQTSGKTKILAGVMPVPQIGNVTHPVLFDYDFQAMTAHEPLQGIQYIPFNYQWATLTGGPISDIGFYIYLKLRDGSYIPWNLPGDSMLDIKFVFSRTHGGT